MRGAGVGNAPFHGGLITGAGEFIDDEQYLFNFAVHDPTLIIFYGS
jgi:hypothetical protein